MTPMTLPMTCATNMALGAAWQMYPVLKSIIRMAALLVAPNTTPQIAKPTMTAPGSP
jgi:hypothetical protein